MSRRGGPAPCFFCNMISLTPAEWKAHNRSCWAGYKETGETSECARGPVHTSSKSSEPCANASVVSDKHTVGTDSSSSAAGVSILLVLRKTAWMSSGRYERIGSVFAAHNLSTCSQLQHIPEHQFEIVLQNIQEPLIEGRLRKLRAAPPN